MSTLSLSAEQIAAVRAAHGPTLILAGFSVGQLKIMQEVITLAVFMPFALLYLKEPLKLDYLWAALCMVGAVYFIFRGN